MEAIRVTLPDGKVQEVPTGTTPAEIARSISPRLAEAALVARVSSPDGPAPVAGKDAPFPPAAGDARDPGDLIDLRRPLDHDVRLQILTEKDPDALYVF